MSKQEKSRKPLIVGIIAAVVVLAVLLVLLLTQCTGGQGDSGSTTAQTDSALADTYDLYWNLDRAEYDGKSEAGLSSRQPEADGYFHVRFFKDGQVVELKVADRKIINSIDAHDLMGLEFDKDGIVVGYINLDDMPVQQVGWKFYVQSVGGDLLKLNSSKASDGMELLLEILSTTGIYDMTGVEGEVGKSILPTNGDRVIALANMAGELTHVFIFDRSEYMATFEGHCEHCEKDVTWNMWTKTNVLPTADGHYQLQNDMQLTTQASIEEDAKICLDLNGKKVDGANNKRIYSLHNPGANLAIVDTSEEQTGALIAHGTDVKTQGMCVWVRYGAFYLYSGTLDASDVVSTLNGTCICVPGGTYAYIYGGTVIGGTAKYFYNEEKNSYSEGQGGAIYCNGKLTMTGGTVTGGSTVSAITAWNKDGSPKTYSRGQGGNIFINSKGEFVMSGGVVSNGTANHSGGNVYLAGTASMTMTGGTITGGRTIGKGRNGGNVYVDSKATLNMDGGYITYGSTYNCAADLYAAGTVNMNGGYIGNGVPRNWSDGKVNTTSSCPSVYLVNGTWVQWGGTVAGGFGAIDTKADTKKTSIYLAGLATITDAADKYAYDLFLNTSGDGIKVTVGTLNDKAKIGVFATTGVFTGTTKQANQDNFYSNIPGAEVLYVNECLALGKMGCVCGSSEHFGQCDGTLLYWAPIYGTNLNSITMPTATGNYYLVADTTAKAQLAAAENADVKLDLNGYTLTGPKNKRALTTFNEGSSLTVTDSSVKKTGAVKSRGAGDTQGNCVWVRYGSFTFYGGTLDGSGYVLNSNWDAGKDKIYGTKDDKTSARDGGTVSMGGSTTFTMYGGTIIGNTQATVTATKKVTTGEGDDAVTTEVTRELTSPKGASLFVPKNAVFNMYGGTITGGVSENVGGNVYTSDNATLNLYGGTITAGQGTSGGNLYIYGKSTVNMYDGFLVSDGVAGNGGNIRINTDCTLNMYGGQIANGDSSDHGGNLWLAGTVNLLGGTITGGNAAKGGGNITTQGITAVLNMKNVTVYGGTVGSGANGGNIECFYGALKELNIGEGTLIFNGQAAMGGNIYVHASAEGAAAKVTISGGQIAGGSATANGGNIYLGKNVTATMSGGNVDDGKAVSTGGNICLDSNASLTLSDGIVYGGVTGELDEKGEYVLNDKGAVKTKGWGGNIEVAGTASLVVTGGQIVGGTSGGNGGNIRITGGSATMKMTGGLIAAGTSELDQGGNIFTTGTTELLGGQIQEGTAVNGGNITANSNKVITLKNVAVIGGTATTGVGGNIRINTTKGSTLILGEGAQITDGICGNEANRSGANIHLSVACDVVIDGAYISGNANMAAASSVTVSGNTQIVAINEGDNSLLLNGNKLTVGELAEFAQIGITDSKAGKFSLPTEEKYVANFFSDEGYQVGFVTLDSTLALGKTSCMCGSNDPELCAAVSNGGCDGEQLFWVAWTSGNSLPTASGNWYLTKDVEFTSQYAMEADGEIAIDLNGHTVTDTDNRMLSTSKWNNSGNVTLWITDTSEAKTGTLKVTDPAYDSTGVLLWLDTASTLNLVGGTLDASQAGTAKTGTAIYLGEGSVVNMYGGTVLGGTAANGGAIFAADGSALNIYGGTVSGGKATFGGNIFVSAKASFNMAGGTVTLGTAQAEDGTTTKGGNIYTAGTVSISAGEISYGKAGNLIDGVFSHGTSTADAERKGHAGNLYIDGGTVTISDATSDNTGTQILGGIAGRNGGSIYVGNGTLTVNGGTISGGQSVYNRGGNIWAAGSATVKLLGGKVVDGTCAAGDRGGNLHANSGAKITLDQVTVYGGMVGENAQDSCANINIESGSTVTFGDCSISGYVYLRGTSTVELVGKPAIYGGTTNLSLGGSLLDISKLDTTDSQYRIGITVTAASHVFTDVFTGANEDEVEEYVQYFYSDEPDKLVGFYQGSLTLEDNEGQVALGRHSCLCGNEGEHTSFTDADGNEIACGGANSVYFWAAWDSSSALPTSSGFYYLTGNVDLGSQWQPKADSDIYLDLNGYSITGTYRVIALNKGNVSLTVTDTYTGTDRTGTIYKNTGAYSGQGGLVWLSTNASFTLIDGILDGNGYTNPHHEGALVYVDGSSTFRMCGGEIRSGTNTAASGGNVSVAGTMYLYAGTVTGGKASYGIATRNTYQGGLGGNIYVAESGTLNILGGTVSNGTVAYNELTVQEEKDGELEDVTYEGGGNGGNIAVDGTLVMTGGTVTGGTAPYTFVTGTDEDGEPITVYGGGQGGNIYLSSTGSANISGGTVENGIAGDVTYEEDGTTVKTISKGWGGNIEADKASLTLSGTAIVSGGQAGNNGGNIRMNGGQSSLIMSGGEITGGITYNDQGGNLFLAGTATITGGEITGGQVKNSSKTGGNIAINSGNTIELTNVTVSDGKSAGNGGNISVNATTKCDLVIGEGTVISEGEATYGGNIFIVPNNYYKNNPAVSLTVEGGTIEGGTATKDGGNINVAYAENCTTSLSITGGTITGGTAGGNGGNLYVATKQTAEITGGTISGGVAVHGGGIYLAESASLDLSGTKTVTEENGETVETWSTVISGGTAKYGNGGNIYVAAEAQLTVEGGEITGGFTQREAEKKAGGSGGNIYSLGTVEISKGTVSNGLAYALNADGTPYYGNKDGKTGWGGNINLGQGGALYLTDASADDTDVKILNGIAAGNGGNIYINSNCIAEISGGTVSGGQSMIDHGGNIWVGVSTVKLTGGIITGGYALNGGGNIHGNLGASLQLSNVQITDGIAGAKAGNLEISNGSVFGSVSFGSGTVISGGRIGTKEANSADYAYANVQLPKNYTVTIDSAQINGYMDLSSVSSISISGAPQILAKDASGNVIEGATNLSIGEVNLSVGELTEGARVGITADEGLFGKPVDGLTLSDAYKDTYFTSDDAALSVGLVDGELYLGRTHCVCGRNDAAACKAATNGACDGTQYFWQPLDTGWTKNTTLSGGNYYLTDNASTKWQLSFEKNSVLRLDLNGFTLTDTSSRLFSLNGATNSAPTEFWITDTSEAGTGTIKMEYNTPTTEYAGQGAVIWINNAGTTVNLIAGTLDASRITIKQQPGTAICVSNGTFNMYGGTILGGTTKSAEKVNDKTGAVTYPGGNGGAIYNDANGKVNIYGGNITGGNAVSLTVDDVKNGGLGGVIYSKGTLNISGGTISGGLVEATKSIDKDGNAVFTGGQSSNIYAEGNVTISGGTVAGFVDVSNATSVSISGAPSITGGTTNLNLGSNTITVGTLTSGASIGITANEGLVGQSDGTYTITDDTLAYFSADDSTKGLTVIDGKLWLGYKSCLCGDADGHTEDTTSTNGCNGEVLVWTPWTSTNSLPSATGNYYLTDTVTLKGNGPTINTNRTINIDLKGWNIESQLEKKAGAGRLYSTNGAGGSTIVIGFTNTASTASSSIVIDDSLRGSDGQYGGDEGRVVWAYQGNTTVNVNNVDVDMTNAQTRTKNGAKEEKNGLAFWLGDGRHLNLYNVDISGGNADGSMIYAEKTATVLLHNTTITNHTGNAAAGGVQIKEDSSVTLTLTGNTRITGNKNRNGDASNVVLPEGMTLEVGQLTTGASIGITADEGVFATAADGVTLTYAHKDFFTADSGKIAFTANGLELLSADAHVHCACAGTLGTAANGYVYDVPGTEDDHVCLDIVYTAISGEIAGGSIATGGNWYLEDNVEIKSGHYQMDDITINLCLNGKNWNGAQSKRAISLQNGTNALTVTTCQPDKLDDTGYPTNNRVIASGEAATYGAVVWVRYGSLDFYAGYLDGRAYTVTDKKHGGAVKIESGATMNMYGGTILGASTGATPSSEKNETNGGAVALAGTLNMYNGTIKDGNSANECGNLYVATTGVLNMYDGLITNGLSKSSLNGGTANIGTVGNAAINISGGQIDGRIQALNAGATVKISGSAVIDGGDSGVHIKDNNSLTIEVGNITEDARICINTNEDQTVTVTGSLTQEQVTNQIIAPGYTAALSADGKTITFTTAE